MFITDLMRLSGEGRVDPKQVQKSLKRGGKGDLAWG